MKKFNFSNFLSTLSEIRKSTLLIREMKSSFTVHEERNGLDVTLTLIRIIKEGDMALDETSARIAKKLYLFPFVLSKKFCGDKVTFSEKIREMTMEEIAHAQRCWNEHCEAAWSCYD